MSYFSTLMGLLNGNPTNIRSTGNGELAVEIGGSNTSAFGDLIAVEPTPVVQLDFVYGINTQTGGFNLVQTGSADTPNSRLRLQTGTNATGSSTFTSRRLVKYRPGQGNNARFTAFWETSAARSQQIIGVGNTIDGYFFGLSSTAFGLMLRNNSIDNWVLQSSWNQDKCDGTGSSGFKLNPNYGNVFQIRYPFLGYGNIKYYIQNGTTGGWILCHLDQYANSTTLTQVTNPSLTFYAQVSSTGNTNNLSMYCGSVGIFISGPKAYLGPQNGYNNQKTAGVPTNIFSLRNATTYNSIINRGLVRLRSMSVATASNTVATFTIVSGATLGGATSFAPINGNTSDSGITITGGNSLVSVDTTGSTLTGGVVLFNVVLGSTDCTFCDLSNYDIFIAPGETYTFAASSTNSAIQSIAVNWNEDI